MKLLDLYCCGGGASVGFHRAGFDVTGVDIRAQKNYPFRFIQSDAIEFLKRHGRDFDAVHASPPCQPYSTHVVSRSSKWNNTKGKDEPALILATREALVENGSPWVMENVFGARKDLRASLLLCGTMFGLPIPRHRLFESSELIFQPEHYKCRGVARKFAKDRGWNWRDTNVSGKGRHAGTGKKWSEVMGIDWPMTLHQLREAIPPCFTEYIGRELIKNLDVRANQEAA